MAQGVIDNPIINSPFKEPTRYFEIVDGDLRGVNRVRKRVAL